MKTEKGKPLKPNEDNVLSSVNMWLHVCEMGIDILLSIEFLKLLSKLIPVLLFTTTWANSHNFYSFFDVFIKTTKLEGWKSDVNPGYTLFDIGNVWTILRWIETN